MFFRLRGSIRFSILMLVTVWLMSNSIGFADDQPDSKQPSIGNFILRSSQQPGPMVGFGQNILAKGQKQAFVFADDLAGIHEHYVDVVPSFLYGIQDNLSLFLNVPIAASYKLNHNQSQGLEDAYAQLEYAFYNHDTKEFTDQATLVGSISIPTGSPFKKPYTGNGAPALFIGATLNRTLIHWFAFSSHGILVPTSNNETKIGNQFLYQFGIGRNIKDIGKDWIIAWMVEGDGTYYGRNHIRGSLDPNSGGNVFYLTPSLWVSSKNLVFQLGVGWAVAQHWYGQQNNSTYLLAANFGYTLS